METLIRILKLEARIAAEERFHDPWEFEETISQPCADLPDTDIDESDLTQEVLDPEEWDKERQKKVHLSLGPPEGIVGRQNKYGSPTQ